MKSGRSGQRIWGGRMQRVRMGSVLFMLLSAKILAAPLNCSDVSLVIPDADISYSEGESYVRYQLSYDRGVNLWQNSAYEFHGPFDDNFLLAGIDRLQRDNLTRTVANNYRRMLLESGVHTALGESLESTVGEAQVITFVADDESLPFIYGFHAVWLGDAIQVFSVSGIDIRDTADSPPATPLAVEAVGKLIESCLSDET